MSNREQPNWNTIAFEWDALEDWVIRKEGSKRPYLRYHAEKAMEEFVNRDALVETENLAEEIVELCPHSRSHFSRPTFSYPDDYDTAPVSVHFDADLLDEYRRVVDEETDHPGEYGLVYAKVINQYRTTGGRKARINDRLREAIDVLRAADIELPDDFTLDETDDYDPDAEDIHYNDVALNRLDQRTRPYHRYLVCQNLDPDRERNLHMRTVREAVRQNVGDAPADDDEFLGAIIETLDFVPHPKKPNSGLYVHENRAEEIKGQSAAESESSTATSADVERLASIDSRGFHDLRPRQRLTKIRITFARELVEENVGGRRFEYNYIENQVFEHHEPSASYANKAIEKVATNGGAIKFTTKHGRKCAEVSREGLKRECPTIWAYVTESDAEPERRGQDAESAAKPDEPEQESDGSDALANVEEPTLDELMNAEPMRTDGGRPEPNRPA